MFTSAAWSSYVPQLQRNQYETLHKGPVSTLLLEEATDRSSNFNLTHALVTTNNENGLNKNREKRSLDEAQRVIRSFFPWSHPVLNPQPSNINRPYLIPVWGAADRIPIYFPPQPILYNPGHPPVNPPNQLVPPRINVPRPNNEYLPPDSGTTMVNPEASTEFTGPRFDEDRPIWDLTDNANSVQRPVVPQFPPERATTVRPSQRQPTRRRRPNTQTSTHPPLVHSMGGQSSGANNLSPIPSASQGFLTTTRPPVNDFFEAQTPVFVNRPPRTSTTQRPTPPPQQPTRPRQQPSNCVWAIIYCCSGSSTDYSSQCFEQNNCSGFFWDASPCETDFAKAALASASNYYSNNGR